MKQPLVIVVVVVAALIALVVIILWPKRAQAPEASHQPVAANSSPATTTASTVVPSITPEITPSEAIIEPIDEMASRITKKSFGTFVTPNNSPVQPERFSGYHTGVDVEYGDVAGDVPVRAIADGTVVVSRTADGYGGVVVVEHALDGKPTVALYGHLDPASMVKSGIAVTAGQQIGILGDGFTPETGGERKHLHFAVRNDAQVSMLGYVQNKTDLASWRDPLGLFQ